MKVKEMSPRARRFRAEVLRDYEGLRADERLLLEEICSCMTRIDNLAPDAVVEARQQAALLSKLVNQLSLPNLEEEPQSQEATPKSRRMKAMADRRWDQERALGHIGPKRDTA